MRRIRDNLNKFRTDRSQEYVVYAPCSAKYTKNSMGTVTRSRRSPGTLKMRMSADRSKIFTLIMLDEEDIVIRHDSDESIFGNSNTKLLRQFPEPTATNNDKPTLCIKICPQMRYLPHRLRLNTLSRSFDAVPFQITML